MGGTAEEVVLQLEELFCRYQAFALGWAEHRYHDKAFAEDATQEAFLQLFLRATKGGPKTLGGGAAMIRRNTRWAANNLMERARASAARERRSAPVGFDEDAGWVRHEARELVAAVCAPLSTSHRQALQLRYAEGYSDVDSARLLGIPTKAFQSRRRRALEEARKSATQWLGAT